MAEKKHAKYSASGSERWLNCPGSVALAQKAPEPPESRYAEEGTQAHECLELLLKNPDKILQTEILLRKKYPTDMVLYAAQAAREIFKRVPKGALLYSETKADLSFVHPDTWGTADAVIVEDFGRLTVIDFKYGAGIPVDAVGNSQLAYYALGVADKHGYNFHEVAMVILQPRDPSGEGIREWVIPISELIAWTPTFRDGIAKAEKKGAALATGSWCRFCRAAPICPALSTRSLQEAQIEFDFDQPGELGLPSPESALTDPVRLGAMLTAFDRIETWISEVRTHALRAVENGTNVQGWKCVQKRAIRKWTDSDLVEELAEKKFGEKAFSRSLLSPAQLEKIAPKDWVDSYCSAVSSGVTLVPNSDSRPATNQAALDFTDLPVKTEILTTKPAKPKGK